MIKNEATLNRLLKSGAIKGDLRPIVVVEQPKVDPLAGAVRELTKEIRQAKTVEPKESNAEEVLAVSMPLQTMNLHLERLVALAEILSKQTRVTTFEIKRDATFRIEQVTATEVINNGD